MKVTVKILLLALFWASFAPSWAQPGYESAIAKSDLTLPPKGFIRNWNDQYSVACHSDYPYNQDNLGSPSSPFFKLVFIGMGADSSILSECRNSYNQQSLCTLINIQP